MLSYEDLLLFGGRALAFSHPLQHCSIKIFRYSVQDLSLLREGFIFTTWSFYCYCLKIYFSSMKNCVGYGLYFIIQDILLFHVEFCVACGVIYIMYVDCMSGYPVHAEWVLCTVLRERPKSCISFWDMIAVLALRWLLNWWRHSSSFLSFSFWQW